MLHSVQIDDEWCCCEKTTNKEGKRGRGLSGEKHLISIDLINKFNLPSVANLLSSSPYSYCSDG